MKSSYFVLSLHCSYFTGNMFGVDEMLQDEAIQ